MYLIIICVKTDFINFLQPKVEIDYPDGHLSLKKPYLPCSAVSTNNHFKVTTV